MSEVKYPSKFAALRLVDKFGASRAEVRRMAMRAARRGMPYRQAILEAAKANATVAGFQYARSIIENWEGDSK